MSKTPLQHLQEVLRTKGVDHLVDHYKIKMKSHPKYPNLHQFKYNQLESDMSLPVVQACRGIMLDADNDWVVVCHVLEKFFNESEQHAAEIDWNTARIFEKLDGSLIQLFHYDNKWQMTTSGSPDGGGNVGDFGFTFRELFWKTWDDLGYDNPIYTTFSYAFELCTKYNRIVVKHDKPRIVLLGARKNTTHEEISIDAIGEYQNWEVCKTFNLTTLSGLIDSFSNMDPYDQEGYVVADENFSRVKVKSPAYVAIHHVIGSMSQRNMLRIIQIGESSEFLSHFEEYKSIHDELKIKYDALCDLIDSTYEKNKLIEDRKGFAKAAADWPFSAALFSMRDSKCQSAREYLSEIHIKRLESLLLP